VGKNLNKFEVELDHSMTHFNWYYGRHEVGHISKPCDFWAVVNGIHYDLEAKSLEKFACFPLDNLQEHQKEDMLKGEKNGTVGFIIICFRRRKDKVTNKKYPRGKIVYTRDPKAYAIRVGDWEKIEKEIYKERATIPESYFERKEFIPVNKIRIPKRTGGTEIGWDLPGLLERNGYPKLSKRRAVLNPSAQ